MYTAWFGLAQEPFSIAPDPRLLFMSERHREALAHLLYGVRGGGGFVLLTGEIGTGKTTVCRSFIDQIPPGTNLAYIFNPRLTVPELLETVCHEFGIARPAGESPSVKAYVDALNAFLLDSHAQGRNNVLVIDEAQNLSGDVLEQLRLLTNLETSERKLLQIVLIGQPELRDLLARPELEQLSQRVIARYHLEALGLDETMQYVRHRMEVCGLERPLPFERGALKRIHRLTGGVPRRINLLCDRALLGAFATGQASVTRAIVDKAAAEVFGERPPSAARWRRPALALGLGLAAGVGLLAAGTQGNRPDAVTVAAVSAPSGAPVSAAAIGASPSAARSGVSASGGASGSATASSRRVGGLPPTASAAPDSSPPATNPSRDEKPVLLTDEDQAWRELAQAWKVTPSEGDACTSLEREHLQCYTARGPGLALIRQLDRPGIVKLDANTTRPSYAILAAVDDRTATLRAGGREQVVTLAALAQRWDGEFSTLWRSPEGYSRAMRSGPAVAWLADRIGSERARGRNEVAEIAAEIRIFQAAHGLPVDGRPGPMTFMQAARASGIDEPRLRKN